MRRRLRVVAASVLAVYVMAAFGLVPSLSGVFGEAAVRLDREPFPCEGGSCGCTTAYRCWTSCCCYTLEERIAWAARNGVEVPGYVDRSGLSGGGLGERLGERLASLEKPGVGEPACVLCELEPGKAVVSSAGAGERVGAEDCGSGGCVVELAGDGGWFGLPRMSALACQGLTQMLGLAVGFGVDDAVARLVLCERVERLEVRVGLAPESLGLEVASPPPRVG